MTADTTEPAVPATTPANARRAPRTRWVGAALLILLPSAGAFAWFIWPTRYRFDHMTVEGNVYPVRIDRLAGTTEMLYPSGWRRIGKAGNALPTAVPMDQTLPYAELQKLAPRAHIETNRLFIDLYNGSAWRVAEITVSISVTGPADEQVLSRLYRITYGYGSWVTPLSTGQFWTDLGFYLEKGQKWSWYIASAKGAPD